MTVQETLERLADKARRDSVLKEALLATHDQPNALIAFCRISAEHDCPINAMELIAAGEEAYAAMLRSTNGGGENSPMLEGEDDLYEMFLAGL